MSLINRLFLLLSAITLLASCASPRVAGIGVDAEKIPPYTLERFRDEATIVKGVQVLSFDNPYGEIHVRQTTASAVAWQGVEQRIGDKPRVAQIQPFHEGDQQGVRIRYPGVDPKKPANLRLGRVDLYVFVPTGFLVELRSDSEAINVRRIKDDVRVRSRSGSITIANRGSIDAESITGDIHAFPMQGLSSMPTRLHSGGNILLDVPLFDDVILNARSVGELRSDFPLEHRSIDEKGVTTATWKHGNASKTLDVRAGGSLILQKLVAPVQ